MDGPVFGCLAAVFGTVRQENGEKHDGRSGIWLEVMRFRDRPTLKWRKT